MKALAYFVPELKITPGGAERQIYLLLKQLETHTEIEAHLCVADFGQAEILEFGKLKIWRSCNMQGKRLVALLKLREVLKRINADVYIFRSADLGVAVAAMLVKLLGKKVVYMVANSDEANPVGLRRWCGTLGAMAMTWLYKHADVLAVQSEEQRLAFLKYRKIDVDVKVPNLFVPPSQEEVNVNRERSIVLWVGRCDPLKRPDLFIEMAKRFPEVEFVLVSPKTTYLEYSEKCVTHAKQLKNLTYLGRQTEGELIALYRQARLMVNTSVSEGFSNAMIEALYFEVPILTKGVDPDGIIKLHQLGAVESERELFDKSFNKLLENQESLRAMGVRGRAYVLSEHAPEISLNKLLSAIEAKC